VDLLYGRNPVVEALRGRRRIRRVLVASSAHGLDTLTFEARRRGVVVETVDRAALDQRLQGAHHQGVAAEAEPFTYSRLDDLLGAAEPDAPEPTLLLVLDSLQDPQNFGTLLRTAQACGVQGIIIPEHRAVDVTPAVSNASAGAVEHLRIARVTNLARTLRVLKDHAIWVFGLTVDADHALWSADLRGRTALVVGSEGSGIGRLVRETCDVLVTIPMAPGAVQSLNAAVAGSLALYEALRQRRQREAH
jgi:23S rRNA (guanosine2251-2'-O)-methyltransferase